MNLSGLLIEERKRIGVALSPDELRAIVAHLGRIPTDTELFGQGKTAEQKQVFARMAALIVSDVMPTMTGSEVVIDGGSQPGI